MSAANVTGEEPTALFACHGSPDERVSLAAPGGAAVRKTNLADQSGLVGGDRWHDEDDHFIL